MAIGQDGAALIVDAPGGPERHGFASPGEAAGRKAFLDEALSWIGTPFGDCADVKGPRGAVDCAMLLTRCAVDTGLVAPFDPRPYPPRWHVHRDEERFVDWLTERLGAREVEQPAIGDVAVWQFGRTYSHGGVLLNGAEIVHASASHRMVLRTGRDETLLAQRGAGLRPVRWFDLWSLRR